MQNVLKPNVSQPLEETASQRVAADLSALLNANPNPKKFLKTLANKTNIHEKTLQRILNQENRPSYISVFKIYRYLLSEFDDAKVIERAPEIIKSFLLKANPQSLEKNTFYFSSIDRDIQKNPVFAEIYILASTGPIKKIEIVNRFGKYGIEVLTSMLEKKVVSEVRVGEFILGPNQTHLSPESIASLGAQLIQDFAKPSNGYELGLHFMGFFSEGLTEEAYRQWQLIDQEAYFKKITLAKNPLSLGKKRAFTFMITETLENREVK